MSFWKRNWKNFCNYASYNKKTIILNYVIFFEIFLVLIIIDLVAKQTLYGKVETENWLFGIRSVPNKGLTFLPWLTADSILLTIFNFIILISCLIYIIFLNSKWFAVFIAFIFSGCLGNTVDRLALGYVRDIIYFPWFDKGTFNFADVDVIVGSIGLFLTLIIKYIFFYSRRGNK